MKIGFDVRMINNSGIGTTIRSFLDCLSHRQLDQLVLFGPDGWQNPYPCPSVTVSYPVYSLRQHWGYGRMLNHQNFSFFHMPHYDVPLSYNGPFVSTVFDLIHFLFPEYSTKPFTRLYSRFLLKHVAACASRIITISQNTRQDLVRFFPEAEKKVTVLRLGVAPEFHPIEQEEQNRILHEYRLEPGYILYVGNLRPSKNTLGLITAYLRLCQERPLTPPLLLVGHNTYHQFGRSGFPVGVRHIESIAHGHLPAIYSAAAVFVFPSFYEGFGLPPLEAMACGTPTIVSHVASLPEACGNAAHYIDPHSEDDLMRAMAYLLDSKERREELRREGFERVKKFSWQSFADKTWNIYEEVCGELRR